MRFREVASLGLVVLVLAATTVRADGLIATLPKDGTGASYSLKIRGSKDGQEQMVSGRLTLSSVGSEVKDGQPCRWIELGFIVKDGEQEFGDYSKFLILEKHLQPGNNPLQHVIKAWRRRGPKDAPVKAFTTPEDSLQGPLPVFLSGPLDKPKKLPAKEIESALGKLKCTGVTGAYKYKSKTGSVTGTIELRHHAKSPFGVVAATYDMTIKQGERTEKFRFDLKLAKITTKAKPVLISPK